MKHASLLVAFLASALCLSRVSAQAPSPPLTGKIAHITILGTKNILLDTVRAVLTLHPGDVYTPEATARDVAAIKGIGFFYAVTDKETADPAGGVNVTYTVAENPVVQSIKFTTNAPDGKPSIPFSELTAQMTTQPGQMLNANILVQDLNNLFNHKTGYVVKQGHLLDVSGNSHIDPKTGILIIPLAECYIQSIQITGNSRIKTADILAQMHTKTGDIFNSADLLQDASTLYETGDFRTVNYNWNVSKPGRLTLTLNVIEQPAATGILDEKQGKVIPFLYDPLIDPFPVVQVSVNGKPALPFIVDTGTSFPLSLDTWAIKKIGLTASGSVQKTAEGVSYQEVSVQSVVLGSPSQNFVSKPEKAVVLDLSLLSQFSCGQHIAGIIGSGMLTPITSRFDFAAKTLTIFSVPHAPLQVSRGTVLPLRGTASGVFSVRATLAPNTYADLIVDTGSNVTEVPLSAISVLHPVATAYGSFSETLDATYTCPTLRLPRLDFGALSVPNVVVGTLPLPAPLSLGMNVLAGYRMTLDGPNGQLILEPSAHSGRYVSGWSGLDITQDSQGWKISTIRNNSPARTAGLQVGDRIVTADGIHFDGLTKFQAQDLLEGIFGQPLQATIERGASRKKDIAVSWTPLDIFSAPSDPMDGLTLKKAPDGPWKIEQILHGCPGDLAGLQEGDTITQIQGEEVAKMAITRYGDLVEQPTVMLEVVRAGIAQPFMVRLSVPK